VFVRILFPEEVRPISIASGAVLPRIVSDIVRYSFLRMELGEHETRSEERPGDVIAVRFLAVTVDRDQRFSEFRGGGDISLGVYLVNQFLRFRAQQIRLRNMGFFA
jgi:hypothetical protein